MYCSKCGSKVKEDASFCHNCGDPIQVKTASDLYPKSMGSGFKGFLKNTDTKIPFGFIIAYGIEWLGIIISLFSPICAYYYEYKGEIDIRHYCTVFGGSWAYINTNYNPVSTPEKGHHYAQFFAIIFLGVAILCVLMAILKKRYIWGHILTVCAYALYSYLTLCTARKYFTYIDSENIKFTGMYIFATVLIGISLFLVLFFSLKIKVSNNNKTI